ncbi:DUF3833 domain-containing protein [Amphritea sp. 1_MG-2023]|uniref:DUF3833 domain-containing protein n=1 Tax=Amphritea sp. 1_MG-2023 TaxID=3062670 RepID=UPI0026E1BD12|nr:DUF3833 domain-containing protein [Amphritea sp. 1_MG-2023]MDO6563335.1 DUF3833 domain-containing protein [Amphritea sp. 1_MG-2023]
MTQTTLSLLALALPVLLILPGCTRSVDEYRDQQPALELNNFFNGQLVAYGMVQDFSGKVTRRFRADIAAHWEGDHGILDEHFSFSDGEQQSRCWHLIKQGNHYRGTAEDIVGEAVGEVQGNALNWRYTLQVPVKGRVWNIALDDWLYLIDENNLINRTKMKKFGLPVGELTLHIRKLKPEEVGVDRPATPSCVIDDTAV